jgi:hypothetical protein
MASYNAGSDEDCMQEMHVAFQHFGQFVKKEKERKKKPYGGTVQ